MTGGGPGPPSGALALPGAGGREGGVGDEMVVDGDDVEDDVVPTVFRWEHGGRQVRRDTEEGVVEGLRSVWVLFNLRAGRSVAM